MSVGLLTAAGGVGLFLLGMALMTEGLRSLAGASLRRSLARFTRTPWSAALAGIAATTLVQSSAAVTVVAVGFVEAGLMTFPQTLGVLVGASVGTTLTGWLLVLIGFKFKLGLVAMPLVLLGALARLLGGGAWRTAGLALAGFALLFVGIETMKEAMSAFEGLAAPASVGGDGLAARLALVAIGLVATIITQSSTAGVAALLVALEGDAIGFPEAAALVIGMNAGTTFAAALATIGGAPATRRTGYAHVLFNTLSSAMAFVLLDPLSQAAAPWIAANGVFGAQIALVAFHTGFNVVGAIIALPFAGMFTRLVIRLTPGRGRTLTRRLNEQLLSEPGIAIDAAAATLDDIARILFQAAARIADPRRGRPNRRAIALTESALTETAAYLDAVPSGQDGAGERARLIEALHALDYLSRLRERCGMAPGLAAAWNGDVAEPRLRRLSRLLSAEAEKLPRMKDRAAAVKLANRVRKLLRAQREPARARAVAALAESRIDAETAVAQLDAIRWMHRVSYHLWRATGHLAAACGEAPGTAAGAGQGDGSVSI